MILKKQMNKAERGTVPPPTLSGYVWIFTLLSFFGWCFEKVGRYLLYPGDLVRDRGFLSLPFCTIYGTCVVLIGFLLGSPNMPSPFLQKWLDRMKRLPPALDWMIRVVNYFFAATLMATLVELISGGVFKLLGIPLWNYSERWGNLWGIICPSFSLLWGILITVLMSLIWRPICILLDKIPSPVLRHVARVMVCVLLADFLFNCVYVIMTGGRFLFL